MASSTVVLYLILQPNKMAFLEVALLHAVNYTSIQIHHVIVAASLVITRYRAPLVPNRASGAPHPQAEKFAATFSSPL